MPYCTFEHHCFCDICWFSVKTTLVNQSKAVSTQNDVMQISNLTLDVHMYFNDQLSEQKLCNCSCSTVCMSHSKEGGVDRTISPAPW